MTSGLSLQSRNACALRSSPRTAASISPATDFAFPGCMLVYIPAPRRARKFTYLNIFRPCLALQTADLLLCSASNGDAVKMWCYGRLRGPLRRFDSPRLHARTFPA